VLRIRRFGARCILTYKGTARFSGLVKQREELELAFDGREADMMAAILDRIGYQPWFRYEKDREIWRLGGGIGAASDPGSSVEICLDHTPMGDFVELEGPIEALEPACVALGLDPEKAVRGSYVTLWEEHRASNPTAPTHMVFEP
jgi:adenylate cyclase class 2